MKPFEILFTWYNIKESELIEDVLIIYGVDKSDAERNFMINIGCKLNFLDILEINEKCNF